MAETHRTSTHKTIIRFASQHLISDLGIRELNTNAVVYMCVKERRLTWRDEDVEHTHVLILEFKMMSRLISNRHG